MNFIWTSLFNCADFLQSELIFDVSTQDPSRNHCAYRLTVAKMEPPIIPFMPLLIKGKAVLQQRDFLLKNQSNSLWEGGVFDHVPQICTDSIRQPAIYV